MTDADDSTPEDARRALDRATEERPDEVIESVERLQGANDLLDRPARSRPRRTPTEEPIDGFADTTAALFGAIGTENTAALERNGTLRDLAEAGETLREFEAELGETTADLFEAPRVTGEVGRVLRALKAAEAALEERLSPLAFVRELRDEEVQRGLGYLVALARELGREE